MSTRVIWPEKPPDTISDLLNSIFFINMGLIQVPDIESYWSTNWISSIPFFSHLYAHEPFEQIFWMLHASHGDPGGEEKRIDKVKIVLDLLVE